MIEYLPDTPDTLADAAVRYWPRFVAIWMFPVFMIMYPVLAKVVGGSVASLAFVTLFFSAFAPPGGLWMSGKIRYLHVVVLGVVVPGVIWIGVVVLKVGFMDGVGQ